ncbi:hypothetical protein, partial [Pseudomonas aeruginosa]|uniref:hypothetical protein n=1 Tax=Pseudomonas aeruginosa TaxID=287 RepID=UPI0021561F0E
MRRASLHMLLCQFAMALGLLLSLGSEAWAARPAPQAAVDLEAPALSLIHISEPTRRS